MEQSSAYLDNFADAYEQIYGHVAVKSAYQIFNFFKERKEVCQKSFSVLDLFCGGGSLASIFLAQGATVVGIDSSSKMLEIAKVKNSNYSSMAEWILGDASCFSNIGNFDLIVATSNSINLLLSLDNLSNCFSSISKNLSANGLFTFDIKTIMGAEAQSNFFIQDSPSNTLIIQGYFDKPANNAHLRFLGFTKNNENGYKKFEHFQVEHIYDFDEVKNLLYQHGFSKIEYYKYGSEELEVITDTNTQYNVVIVAEK